jgi:dephospho-CoA kinase
VKWIGLVGLIGSGKSTAGKLFVDRGCRVIDVDMLNRELQQPGQELFGLIVDHFGKEILAADGTIDRPALGNIVFNDKIKLGELTGLVASITEEELVGRALEYKDSDTVVFAEAAMILGKMYGLEGVILVDAPEEASLDRLVSDRGMSEQDARARLSSQVPRETRIRAADYVIDNSRDMAHLEAEVGKALEWIKSTPDADPRVVRSGEQAAGA